MNTHEQEFSFTGYCSPTHTHIIFTTNIIEQRNWNEQTKVAKYCWMGKFRSNPHWGKALFIWINFSFRDFSCFDQWNNNFLIQWRSLGAIEQKKNNKICYNEWEKVLCVTPDKNYEAKKKSTNVCWIFSFKFLCFYFYFIQFHFPSTWH